MKVLWRCWLNATRWRCVFDLWWFRRPVDVHIEMVPVWRSAYSEYSCWRNSEVILKCWIDRNFNNILKCSWLVMCYCGFLLELGSSHCQGRCEFLCSQFLRSTLPSDYHHGTLFAMIFHLWVQLKWLIDIATNSLMVIVFLHEWFYRIMPPHGPSSCHDIMCTNRTTHNFNLDISHFVCSVVGTFDDW